jgi:3-oxoadipate enol-lactonase
MIDGFRSRTTSGAPDLAYLDSGGQSQSGGQSREALVLLHSLGTDHRLWEHCAASLAEGHRVLVPDSRGHGGSGWAGPLTVEDWVADLGRVLEHAGVDKVALIGLSMGGVQAIAYAATYPSQVRALVVADSFAELDPGTARAKTSGLVARTSDMKALADFYVESTFTVEPLPAAAESVRDAIASMEPDAYAVSAETCFGARLDGALDRIGSPTLVLWGDRDTKTPRELSERIAGRVRSARLEVVPGAGHLSTVENPGEFTRLVCGFLTEND